MDLKLCRICLSKSATISLFGSEGEVPHSARVMRCVNVVVAEGDGLPDSICEPCAADLLACYHFVNRCEASDKALRAADGPYTHVKTEIKVEKELIIENNHDDILVEILPDHLSDSNDQCDVIPKRKYSKRKKESGVKDEQKTEPKLQVLKCDLCEHVAPNKSTLREHMKTHGPKMYSCPLCGREFNDKGNMMRHKRKHTGERPYPCTTCPKAFTDKDQLKRHLTYVHSKEKRFPCTICSKSLKTKDALNCHIRHLHSTPPIEQQTVCNYCGVTFTRKGALHAHIKVMHSERSGHCDVCFKTYPDLEAHMRMHNGEKPFVCKLCDQGCASKRSLSHHMSTKHNNVSKYKCSVADCHKMFRSTAMLEFHLLKQHTNHTPFVCQHCSRGFFRMCGLTKHLRMSHNMDKAVKVTDKIDAVSLLRK